MERVPAQPTNITLQKLADRHGWEWVSELSRKWFKSREQLGDGEGGYIYLSDKVISNSKVDEPADEA
jgi:hypothetical protein